MGETRFRVTIRAWATRAWRDTMPLAVVRDFLLPLLAVPVTVGLGKRWDVTQEWPTLVIGALGGTLVLAGWFVVRLLHNVVSAPFRLMRDEIARLETGNTQFANENTALRGPPALLGAPPLRLSIGQQATYLTQWLKQVYITYITFGQSEMWLSNVFQHHLSSIPRGPSVVPPDALRHLAAKGHVQILDQMERPYRTPWGEVFQDDIRFRVVSLPEGAVSDD